MSAELENSLPQQITNSERFSQLPRSEHVPDVTLSHTAVFRQGMIAKSQLDFRGASSSTLKGKGEKITREL